jgi:hypothetical protein
MPERPEGGLAPVRLWGLPLALAHGHLPFLGRLARPLIVITVGEAYVLRGVLIPSRQ